MMAQRGTLLATALLLTALLQECAALSAMSSCAGGTASTSCDARCVAHTTSGYRWCSSSSSTSNLECVCGCANTITIGTTQNVYRWVGTDRCETYCPPNYFGQNAGDYCTACHSWCLTCTGTANTQCTSCTADSYQYNATSCYNFASASDHSYNMRNPCLDGTYGIQKTRKCEPCPTGCATCSIYLGWEMPGTNFVGTYDQQDTDCTGDPLCRYTLRCFSCSSGYTLLQGHCVSTSQCFSYSFFSGSGAFAHADCTCYDNYQLVGLSICTRCDITCLTCTPSTTTTCLTCPDGASVSGLTCAYNSTYSTIVDWKTNGVNSATTGTWTDNAGSPRANVNSTGCTTSDYVFGYFGVNNQDNLYYDNSGATALGANFFPVGATLTYNAASLGTDHYGVRVRATLLFIDQWTNGMTILFQEGGLNRFQFSYRMEDIVGEYVCGLNYYDHFDVVDNWFAHSTASISNLRVKSSQDGFAWGIRDVFVQLMKCHSSCETCSGPTASDCILCPANEMSVDGICLCNITAGYYLDGAACVTSCSGGKFKDNTTHTCVAACAFPLAFSYNGECHVGCPDDWYKNYGDMSCTQTCYDSGQADQTLNSYRFNGSDRFCNNTCPSGTFGDPSTGDCVRTCPAYNASTNDGWFSHGSFCYEICPTSTFAYPPQRACLSSCPSGYYKNWKSKTKSLTSSSHTAGLCEQQCTITLTGDYLYGDNITGQCTNFCSVGTYGDIETFLCLQVCNSSAFGQEITLGNGTVQRLCVINCSLSDGVYGNPQSGYCVLPASCPTNYYADPDTFQCTRTCSDPLRFGDNSTKKCDLTCASGWRQNDTKICVATCLNNNSGLIPEYGDPRTGYCVDNCTGSYFADSQANMECVLTCSATPASTFGENFMCVTNCSGSTWADPYHPNRICTTSCTNSGGTQSYGLNDTRSCVTQCPDYQFAHNVSGVPLCTWGCLAATGKFGNVENNKCQDQCPGPYFGDVTDNRTCVIKCPWPYFGEDCTQSGSTFTYSADRVCKLACACGWADNDTQLCVWNSTGCANFTFAHESNHKCVVSTECTGFGDPLTRYCIDPCFTDSTTRYFADPSTKLCVLVCPESPDYFGDNATQTCQLSCTGTTVRDPQNNRRCVTLTNCSTDPLYLYGDHVKDLCVVDLNCSDGYYADNVTHQCIEICPGPVLLYADNITKQCVAWCERSWYALNITANQGVCSLYCPWDLWADNYTLQCQPVCTNKTYGVNYTMAWVAHGHSYTEYGICQSECPDGQFARDGDNLCLTNCGSGLWGDPINRTCEVTPFDCPEGYYADNTTNMCVQPLSCSNVGGVQYVADNSTKECVAKCPSAVHNYADMAKQLCVEQCPDGYFGFNDTLECQLTCKFTNNSWQGSFADSQLDICVEICSATPTPTFGENDTYTCVEAKYCPDLTWAEVEVYNRQCRPICPTPNMVGSNPQKYADNHTKTCVEVCPTYSFADLSTGEGICVFVCPQLSNGTLQFSDNSTKMCVTVCPAGNGTWGDNSTKACVVTCPLGSYAQQVPTRYCVAKCSNGTWGEDVKRTCVTDPLMCPEINGTIYYAEDISTMCVATCPLDAGTTDGWWGQNTTKTCRTSCLLPSGVQSGYKWNNTRVCIDQCPAELGRDGSYSDQGMCYYVCMTAGYFRDSQNNRSCQASCSSSPVQQYEDNTTFRCLAECPTFPKMFYRYSVTWQCVSQCPGTYKKYEPTKSCEPTCPNGTYHNVDTDQCVDVCPVDTATNHQLYGDNTQAEWLCVNATDCPAGYYADDRVWLCVNACTNGQWIHGKTCLSQCPHGYYGNPSNLTCVVPLNCPADHYADDSTVTCVTECAGSFADTLIKVCVDVCPVNGGTMYYADPVTRKCATTCTNNATIQLHQNHHNQTCVSDCDPDYYLDPFLNHCELSCTNGYYADNSTRTCVEICPSTPSLFGENASHTCVSDCLQDNQFRHTPWRLCIDPCPSGYFKDNLTRLCVTDCYNASYADADSGYCIFNCTPKYAHDDSNLCLATCPSPYFNDPTTMKCVFFCPTWPVSYFQHADGATRECLTTCPTGYYRDHSSYACVQLCSQSPLTFADNVTGDCVSVCSDTYYGYKAERTCVLSCTSPLFADPLTRRCVSKCDPVFDYFGESTLAIPQCVQTCQSGRFTDPVSQQCVAACPNSPKMYAFDNGDSMNPVRQCLYTCPFFYVADNQTSHCLLSCVSGSLIYIDQATQSCVEDCGSDVYLFKYMPNGQSTNGTCVKFCPDGTFALLTNNSCVTKCPDGLFGSATNNTCFSNCSLANDEYADPANNLCTQVCTNNASYFSYADEHTRTCVTNCTDTNHSTVGDKNNWKCMRRCSSLTQYADTVSDTCVDQCPVGYFADNITQTCVTNCSLFTLSYGDLDSRTCVSQCLTTTLYADDATRLCVNSTSCPAGFFGYNSTKECIDVCPETPSLFGDPVSKRCEAVCPTSPDFYFADWSTRECVLICPQIPSLFGYNTSQTCMEECPVGTWADNHTRYCIAVCSITPIQTFADNSTNRCVDVCPTEPDYYFASNHTWECVVQCPSTPNMFGDNSTRSCVYNCPGGAINTYADSASRRCVDICPGSTFNQNSTRTCEGTCLTGYADSQTKYCIAICPAYTYGDNDTDTCGAACGVNTFSQQMYAEDGNNLCMTECMAVFGTYRDPHSKRCVKICPISQNYFADQTNRQCVAECLISPLTYADFSTRKCVATCPTMPALFAISNSDRVCTAVCPNGTWADNTTRFCQLLCDETPQTYGDNSTWTCVSTCPNEPNYYADNSTHLCVEVCPSSPDLYADNITRKCVYHCPNLTFADPTTRRCVTTCPDGYFAVNSTQRCVQDCPWRQFADNLTHICVAQCSVDPIFYGNPDNLLCVDQCPAVNNSFGNPLTQECVNYQLDGTSGCPVAYFADNTSRLCTEVCPMLDDTYGDNSTWKCVSICPAGAVNTFSDNSTMMCVVTCPSYPDFYAEEYSRRCVHFCLDSNTSYSGSFADNSTRLCVEQCPSSPDYFSDNSTKRCVFYCPRYPLTFADNSTRRCVTQCPSSPDIYGDLKSLRCVPQCPRAEETFADYTTRLCVKTCPSSPALFAENTTLRCSATCPNGSFADNLTRRCVAKCPREPETYGDPSTNICVDRCPADPDLYADPNTQQCVSMCPEGFFAENNTRKCLDTCLYNSTNYADNLTNRCVERCPSSELTYGDNETQRCVSQCPLNPYTYADNMTQMCLHICNNETAGGYADNITRICVIKCPNNSYGDITTRYCVTYCPVGWFAHDVTNMCLTDCPTPYFADNTTWRCVTQCSLVENVFGESINNTCVYSCPEGTYASEENQECVARCPNSSETALGYDTFGYNDTNECVSECPFPLYGYTVPQICVDVCPDPYYENVTDHRCYQCPVECASCEYPELCLTCIADHFLYAGACLESCPTFPTITYANPNRVCGAASECTQGYFALNSTKSCVTTCPAGFYINIAAQTCDSCMRGCTSCTNGSSCLACDTSFSIWSDYTCYLFCSRLRPFYSTTGCVSACPEGFFQNLVTCQACSGNCKTCVISAENCLVCANGYYISNSICVSECPTDTIAQVVNGSQTCVSCSQADCSTTPLTFEVTKLVDNFQFTLQLQFNQPVNITEELSKVIQLQKRTVSRLLTTTFEYLNYTIIDYGNGLYAFVLNDYDPASGSDIEVQILDPSAIVGPSGQIPTTTRSSVQTSGDTIYSLDDYNQHIDGYVWAGVITALVVLVATFWAHHSIWMPVFDYMQLTALLVLVNVSFPPNLLYSVERLLVGSSLAFLPNMFEAGYSHAPYDDKYLNNNIYSLLQDASFLRTLGPLYTIALILGVVLLVTGILSRKAPSKGVKRWAKGFFRETFWKKHLHGIVYLLYLPTLLLAVFGVRLYSYFEKSPIHGFSIFSSWLFMLALLVFCVVVTYKLRSWVTAHPNMYLVLRKAYNFIQFQEWVLIENRHNHFSSDDNAVDLTNAREPRINELLFLPFPVETRLGPWEISQPLLSYLHKLLSVVLVVAAFDNPVVQLILLVLLNIAVGVYLVVVRPFLAVPRRQFNNEVTLHNLIVLTLQNLMLLVLVFMETSLSHEDKVLLADCLCGVVMWGLTFNLVYFIYRAYHFHHLHSWQPFVRSDIFARNYTLQHLQWTKHYDQQLKKKQEGVKPRPQLLEAIQMEGAGEALANFARKSTSVSSTTKNQLKAMKLRPSRGAAVQQEYAHIMSSIANEKEKSHRSVVSSERLSKADRKKVRDTIFADKELAGVEEEEYKYVRLEQIEEKSQGRSVREESEEGEDGETELEFEYIEEEYPEGTPMEEIMRGCKKGDVALPM